ncbi:MAG: DNA gyrase subunit A [Dorea sp.]
MIKGPDFPTGGEILGTRGIEEAYRTGRGKIRVRAVTNIETMAERKEPHHCDRASVHGQQGASDREDRRAGTVTKKIDGITDLSDESNREGMRICH